jgi:hypothetical protein
VSEAPSLQDLSAERSVISMPARLDACGVSRSDTLCPAYADIEKHRIAAMHISKHTTQIALLAFALAQKGVSYTVNFYDSG